MAFTAPNAATSGGPSSAAPKRTIAELKNGKVIFRQKSVSFEKASETMQEIVRFREMLDLRIQNQDQPLVSIPEDHMSVIVKLAQESDKGITPLARQIRLILLPGPGEVEDAHRLNLESCLPLTAVEHAIKTVMTRINYGLDGILGQKLPAAVCVWRWEVRDAYRDWLPKSARDSADARLAERIQAKADLREAFESLSQTERDAILDPKGTLKALANNLDKLEATSKDNFSEDHLPKDAPGDLTESEVLPGDSTPRGRTKKVPDAGKAAKVKDKEGKRVAKAEKEKKQKEAQDKSRSIMANFFGKTKPAIRDLPARESDGLATTLVDNEFQRTFKPFVLKKDAQLAPHNWFAQVKVKPSRMTGVTHEEAIVVDDDAPMQRPVVDMSSRRNFISPVSTELPATLRALIEELCQCNLGSCRRASKVFSFKTYNARSVRDVMSQLNDAEIAGDPTQVRHLLSVLRDRQIFPAKVLIFHEDTRPGYYGTWTRNSREVGPRGPLERDVLARDYGYDSGEDWEEEGPGDADDVVEDGEDDEPEAEDPDSDLDSWLVDDDDDEIQPSLDLDDLPPPHFDLTIPPSKRKAENVEKRSEKKRKVVVPLVPFVKGPCWESHIGHCEYDPFNPYRVQLLNDTPFPIDPFAFASVVSRDARHSQTDPSVAVPAFPGTIQASVNTTTSSNSKRTINAAPKTIFPEAHLGILLAKITDLATPNFTFLVESIYQELRVHKIKKNAIEAKVREMGEKSKDKKVWVVKQAAQALYQSS